VSSTVSQLLRLWQLSWGLSACSDVSSCSLVCVLGKQSGEFMLRDDCDIAGVISHRCLSDFTSLL